MITAEMLRRRVLSRLARCCLIVWPLCAAAQTEPCRWALDQTMALASPALRADVILRIVPPCAPATPAFRQEWLDRAMQAAAQAEQSWPTDPVPIGFTDTVPALSAIASRLALDQLSLRLGAITALAEWDPGAAREWFDALAPPATPRLSCADYQVARIDGYYDLLKVLSARSFRPAEIARGDRDAFLASHLFPVTSPAALMGAVRFLGRADLPARSLELLLARLAAQLDAMDSDDRAFTVALLGERTRNDFGSLMVQARAAGVSLTPLLAPLDRYFARHLAQPRCADTWQSEPLREREQGMLSVLDAWIGGASQDARTALVSIQPARLLPADPPRDLVVAIPEYRAWYQELVDRGKDPAAGEPAAAVFARVANRILDGKAPEGFTAREFFQAKALMMARLLQQAGSPEERTRAAAVNLEFFANSTEMRLHYPAVWLFLWNQFAAACRSAGPEARAVLTAAANHADPAVAAYARVAAATPDSPPAASRPR